MKAHLEFIAFATALTFLAGAGPGSEAQAQAGAPFDHLQDRGSGMPTSMFGTYVRKGELLFYPFAEYYADDNLEYKPSELGYSLEEDFRGTYRASEVLMFASYGITQSLAVEIEGALIDARLETDPNDPSGIPAVIEENGVGDIEGQIRYRWNRESESRPEWFSYLEAVSPQNTDKVLIGTPDWELKLGTGAIKGMRWGTMTARFAVVYTLEDQLFDLGEYGIEYLRRVSPSWRLYLGIEGSQDEMSVIPEVQWHFSDWAFFKLNSGIGITSKATDWAPEVGIMFSLSNLGK